VALRFQLEDDVDRKVNGGPGLGCGLLVAFGIVAFFIASYAVDAFISGKSFSAYKKDSLEDIAGCIVIAWLSWLVVLKYEEFRARTKEIDGKVSEIEKVVGASRDAQTELLERLTVIEDKLDAVQRELENGMESSR